ncbi:condensation domain-containing protein [Kitasatospora sp. NPDC057223]|uniref:condensation domain-containing protein n=1 Tax=Kitasatospora sp. NPDC057223 TaxID=3346055 RepID=UPI003637DA6E
MTAGGASGAGDRGHRQGRPLSYNQEFHYRAARPSAPASPAVSDCFAVAFEIPGVLDREALEAALLHFVRRHEVLRCVFRESAGTPALDVLAPRDVKLEPVEVGLIGTREEARAYVRGFLRQTDTRRGPWTVMGAMIRDDSTTVYVAFDHIVTDGMSMMIAVNDIATAYAAIADGRRIPLPEPAGYLDHADRERHSSRTLTADDGRLDHWREFTARNGGFFPPFPLALGTRPGIAYRAVNETHTLLPPDRADAMEARCREAGARLSTGLLAAVAVSQRREGGPDVYRGLLPISTRGRGFHPPGMGWFINILPIEFSVAAEHDFDGVMAGAQAASTRMARSIHVPFTVALRLLAPRYHSAPWPCAVNFFSYMDFREAPGAGNHAAWRAGCYTSVPFTNGVLLWLHRTDAGLHVNCAFADTPQARRTTAGLVRTLARTMDNIATRGQF